MQLIYPYAFTISNLYIVPHLSMALRQMCVDPMFSKEFEQKNLVQFDQTIPFAPLLLPRGTLTSSDITYYLVSA